MSTDVMTVHCVSENLHGYRFFTRDASRAANAFVSRAHFLCQHCQNCRHEHHDIPRTPGTCNDVLELSVDVLALDKEMIDFEIGQTVLQFCTDGTLWGDAEMVRTAKDCFAETATTPRISHAQQ